MSRVAVVLVATLLAASLPSLAFHDASSGPVTRDVTFESRNGNEWWVQVDLSGADEADVTAVEARDTDGAWRALEKKSWGDWAGSFHVEPGHHVQFAARFSDGSFMESCWMTHPGGACVDEEEVGSGAFAFEHEGGNEWWVQVDVAPEPAAVEARDTGGDWRALEKKSWGDWAGSFHVEPGHDVRFRAQDASGAWHASCWFSHPDGVAQCEAGDGEFAASFETPGGNAWWVEVYVDANAPLAGVDARIVGEGTWRALEKKSWGAWAASFHVPDGSRLEFRATSAGGGAVVSEQVYRWPSGEPEPRPSWPSEGSYVRYLLDSGESVPGYSQHDFVWVNLTFEGGAWHGTCEGWNVETVSGDVTRERIPTTTTTTPPATGPRDVQPGEGVDVGVPGCDGHATFTYVDGRGVATHYHGEPHRQHGEPVEIPVWRASWENDGCPCEWRSVRWHWDTGLTVDHVTSYRHSYESGHLVDTDAPVSPEETSTPPQPAWPREGSFATYEVNLTSKWSDEVTQVQVRFDYRDGAWQAACDDRTGVDASPPMAPTDTEPGAKVRPTEATQCDITPAAVVVQGRFPHDTTREGEPHRATVWWADESREEEADGEDEDAWWDVDTGLVLKWEDFGGYYSGDEGWLTDTDAPLSEG